MGLSLSIIEALGGGPGGGIGLCVGLEGVVVVCGVRARCKLPNNGRPPIPKPIEGAEDLSFTFSLSLSVAVSDCALAVFSEGAGVLIG